MTTKTVPRPKDGASPAANTLIADQINCEPHLLAVGDDLTPATMINANPMDEPLRGSLLPEAICGAKSILAAPPVPLTPDQRHPETHGSGVGGLPSPGHIGRDFPKTFAGRSYSVDQGPGEAQVRSVGGKLSGDNVTTENQDPSVTAELLFCAEFLDDTERVRIANDNRLRSMAAVGIDTTPYQQQAAPFAQIEHQATLALQRALRKHPLGPFVKRTTGIGEKQGARLIASIGDLTYNHLEDRPRRGPAELWAYCGFIPGQRRQKGIKSNWNASAKMRAFLIAEKTITMTGEPDKNGKPSALSPYRATYDNARHKYATATHDRPCPQCGPKGKPAQPGSPLSLGHQHARALRVVAKEILKDMFLEAKALDNG